MAEEREAAFPIDVFGGVNRNSDREQIGQNQFYQLNNLWERRLGTLETRNGSSEFVQSVPSNTATFENLFKIYKPSGDTSRIAAVQAFGAGIAPNTGWASTLPGNIALSFVNDANGWWNNSRVLGGTTFNFLPERVIVRLVGYGTDLIYSIDASTISGYVALSNQHLRVRVTSALPAGVTGIEILARVPYGSTRVPAAVTTGSTYQYRHLWVGFIDMNGLTTTDTSFLFAPYGSDPSYGFPVTLGDTSSGTKMTFTASGVNSNTGTLTAGKTYYVLVMPQYAKFATGNAARGGYTCKQINYQSGDVVPVTIPTGSQSTGYIQLSQFGLNVGAFIVACGEAPQLLQPIALYNDSGTVNAAVQITSIPSGNPAVVGVDAISSTASAIKQDLTFVFSNYSKADMFVRLDDAGNKYPVFCGNMFENEGTNWDVAYCSFGVNGTPGAPNETGSGRQYVNDLVNGGGSFPDRLENIGAGCKYRFVQWLGLALVVNDQTGTATTSKVPSYFATDGKISAPVPMDFQTVTASARQTLPNSHFIIVFQGSVIIGGGTPGIDPNTGRALSSARSFFISRAGSFTDFTIAGAAAPVLNFVTLDQNNAENLSGFGVYSNTTNFTGGPQTKLGIFTRNQTWLIDTLPTFDTSGALNNFSSVNLRQLSRKVGAVTQETVAYTPLGTVFCGLEGVFLLRENGEPTPVGQNLIDIFRQADFRIASACYHDKHYKLAFVYPATNSQVPALSNNQEWWLNINKMIETKGSEDWVGPMTGRGVYRSFVEDKDGDSLSNGIPRNRYVSDGTHIYLADPEPGDTDTVVNDIIGGVTTAVTSVQETKDLQVTRQDAKWNKNLKRWYWGIRTNLSPITLTDKTWIDGTLVETQTITQSAANVLNFRDQPFNMKRVFPGSRLRGRVIRKQLTCASRVAYNTFEIHYEVERRRI